MNKPIVISASIVGATLALAAVVLSTRGDTDPASATSLDPKSQESVAYFDCGDSDGYPCVTLDDGGWVLIQTPSDLVLIDQPADGGLDSSNRQIWLVTKS